MRHDLKIWPQFYCRVADGSKTFELRNNDRAFQSGDTIVLREWDPTPINSNSLSPRGYLTESEPLEFTVGHIQIVSKNEVIFSLLPVKRPAKLTKLK